MKTNKKIMYMLKKYGSMTAKTLASELGLTTMGVRQHMLQLEVEGDVSFEDKKAIRGRPTRFWSLTPESASHFPDGHELLTVQLIDSIKLLFGESGIDKLIEHRELESFKSYSLILSQHHDLVSKLKALASIRTEEGYMATVVEEGDFYWLLENHCSICAAASHCLSFCRSELNLFKGLLSGIATVVREEHILMGARRCAYKIVPVYEK